MGFNVNPNVQQRFFEILNKIQSQSDKERPMPPTEEKKEVIVTVTREQPLEGKIYISPELGEKPACYDEAIKWIEKKKKEDSTVVEFAGTVNVYPADGAYALFQVLKKKFGWIEQQAYQQGWFTVQPKMVEVQTDVNERTTVPWGKMQVPGINADIYTGSKKERGIWRFNIYGKAMKMHEPIVNEIIELTREYVKTHSIYRGKNVRLEWDAGNPMFGDEPAFDFPKFLPSTGLQQTDLILPEAIWLEVDAGLFSLVLNASKAREMGVPTKRLTVLAGPYGTGKTMTAAIVGELCRKVRRTLIYLADVRHLAEAIRFSEQYAPALIFAEDIDSVTDEDEIDLLSNTVDGIDTKNLDVMVVLTTNHLETIPQKFLRPGRSDLIIEFEAPDAVAAGRLVLKYGAKTLDPSFTPGDAMDVGEDLAGMIPASIREVVERAKLFAIANSRSAITKADIHLASLGVKRQARLLEPKDEHKLPKGWNEIGVMVAARPSHVNNRLESLEEITSNNNR